MRRLVTRQHAKSRGPFKPLLVAFAGLYVLYANSIGQLSFGQLWGNVEGSSTRRLLGTEVSDASLAAADVQYAIEAPAPVSGFVHKSGPVKLFDWTPGNRSARHGEFNRWMQAAAAAPDSELAAAHEGGLRLQNLPPVYPNCQVLVNHRYKFIFVRHPKSASSSLMVSFGTCSAGNTTDSTADRDHESSQSSSKGNLQGGGGGSSSGGEEQRRRLQVSSSWDRHQFGAACLEPMAATELPPEEIERIWREYFVFTVVRNPYQRMLSAYKFLLRKTRANPACATVRWDDHCRDPLALGRMCAANHECCPLPAGFYWHHVIDQGRCLLTEGGSWAVDYIATVERFNEQMREVLEQIDRRRHVELPPLRRVTRELAQQNEARNKGACAAAAAAGGGDEEQLDPESLLPEKTRVLVGDTWVPYNATVLLDRYCEPADYFRGEHEHCLLQARHFYSTDFEVLYSKNGKRGKA